MFCCEKEIHRQGDQAILGNRLFPPTVPDGLKLRMDQLSYFIRLDVGNDQFLSVAFLSFISNLMRKCEFIDVDVCKPEHNPIVAAIDSGRYKFLGHVLRLREKPNKKRYFFGETKDGVDQHRWPFRRLLNLGYVPYELQTPHGTKSSTPLRAVLTRTKQIINTNLKFHIIRQN